MIKKAHFLLTGLALSIGATGQVYGQENHLIIHKEIALNKSITAASGVEYWQGKYYIVSDNNAYLSILDHNGKLIKNITLYTNKHHTKDQLIKKAKKADFEAIAQTHINNEPVLIILASGSKENRHKGFIFNLITHHITSVDLKPLYHLLKAKAGFPKDTHINIEGLAIGDDKVYIANRGNSYKDLLFVINKSQFFDFLQHKNSKTLHMAVMHFKMPNIGSYTSTFSGLDYIKKQHALAFSTSIELTDDAYHDGLILGSFIGEIPIDQLKNNLDLNHYSEILFDTKGVIQTKIESIIITDISTNGFNAVLVSDNDNGTSQSFNISYSSPTVEQD